MLQENEVDFKEIEKVIYGIVCEIGRGIMNEILVCWDKDLHDTRDRSVYRDKGRRKTVLKTLMGEVEYSRYVYSYQDEEGRRGTIYLLDEAMGCKENGFLSEALMERIAAMICNATYRETAGNISACCGQSISHTGVWNAVQAMGKRIEQQEEDDAARAKQDKGRGETETKVLFEEQDGIWLHLQGDDRKKYGNNKEMKLSIAYDGAKKTGKDRYELTGKVACANFEGVDQFYWRKEGVIAAKYNVDEIEYRILNADGAEWAKRSITDETVHYQLDLFHRNQAIRKAVKSEDAQKTLFKLLYTKQIDDMFLCIDTLISSAEEEKEEDGLKKLYGYLSNNRDGLIPCHRRGLGLPEAPEGKEYRRGGAMESNVFSIIGKRMKGNRRLWSISGGNNLARLLCLKASGRLQEASRYYARDVGEKYAEEVVVLSATKVKEREGKGYDGFHNASVPSSMPWLKDLARLQSFSELWD